MNVARLAGIVLLSLPLAACRAALEPHRDVPLVWKVDREPSAPGGKVDLTHLLSQKFRVLPLEDKRTEPKQQIGVNVQRADRPLPVTTRDDVAAWATDRLKHVLARQGLKVVEEGQTVTLRGEILRLGVTEAGLFNGEAEIAMTAESKGKVVWRGVLSGKSRRMGKTYKLENYYEALSNALQQAAGELVESAPFVAALK